MQCALEIGPGSGVYLPTLASLFDKVVAADIASAFLRKHGISRITTPTLKVIEDDIVRSILRNTKSGRTIRWQNCRADYMSSITLTLVWLCARCRACARNALAISAATTLSKRLASVGRYTPEPGPISMCALHAVGLMTTDSVKYPVSPRRVQASDGWDSSRRRACAEAQVAADRKQHSASFLDRSRRRRTVADGISDTRQQNPNYRLAGRFA